MVHKRNDGKIHEKDEARTPMGLFLPLDEKYHFELDAAADPKNALCPGYYTKEDNALIQPWFEDYGEDGCVKSVYCNPPYSPGNIEPFCKKAYEESLKGAVVVMLLPMDSSTQWFHKYCSKAYKWIIFAPRVKFLHPSGIPFGGSPKFGTFACVFDEVGRRSLSSTLVEFVRWKP
jgi:phage N-6-adenine-methyltransferase